MVCAYNRDVRQVKWVSLNERVSEEWVEDMDIMDIEGEEVASFLNIFLPAGW